MQLFMAAFSLVSTVALPLTEGILCHGIVAEELMQADSLSKELVDAVHLLK